jgi:hypothetical protein
MMSRVQGPLRAVLLIAAIVGPAVALGYLAYTRYGNVQGDYLKRLNYLELGIAAEQFASRLNGWRQWSQFRIGRLKLEGGGCAENIRTLVEDPEIACASDSPWPAAGAAVAAPAPTAPPTNDARALPETPPAKTTKTTSEPTTAKPSNGTRKAKRSAAIPASNLLIKDTGEKASFYVDIPGGRDWWGSVSVATILEQLNVDPRRFDDLLLLTSSGWVIQGRTMARVSLLDALGRSAPAADAGKPAAAPQLTATEVGTLQWHDEDHLVFVRPTGIRLPVVKGDGDARHVEEVELVLAGLVSRARFDDERQRIAYPWVLGAVLLVVTGLLSWPLLAFRLIGPHERFSAADVRILGFSLIGLAGLLPAVLLAIAASGDFAADVDSQLPEIARMVRTKLEERIDVGLDLLAPHESADDTAGPPSKTRVSEVGADGIVRWTFDVHPSNWWQAIPTVGISVADRGYFQTLRRRNGKPLWVRDGQEFVAEIVRSKRQNVYKLIVAQARSDPRRPPVALANVDIDAFKDPVLPPGVDFAIIDEAGQVQLHSRNSRNVVENFFEALDDDAELRAAVAARRVSRVTARYAGDETVLLVSHLGTPPWSLVVFRSAESVQTLLLESVGRFAVLFVGYVTLCCLAILLFEGVTGRYRFRWLWPDRGVPNRVYVLVAARTTILALLLWAAWDGAPLDERVLLVGFMPLLGLVAAGRDLAHGRSVTTTTERRLALAVLVVACIAVTSVSVARLLEHRPGAWHGAVAAALAFVPAGWLLGSPTTRVASEGRFRIAYVACLIALLGLVAAMPATVLFDDARTQVREEFLQTLRDRFPDVEAPTQPANAYPTSLAGHRVAPASEQPREQLAPARQLSAVIAHLLPVYSRLVAEVRQRRGEVPPWSVALRVTILMVGTALAACLALVTLFAVVRGMFHLDADPMVDGARLLAGTDGGSAVFVYRHLGNRLPEAARSGEPATIDLRAVREPQSLEAWWSANRSVARRFEFGHLEARLHDPQWQDAILDVLEELAFDPTCAVLVTSAIEPFDYVRASAALERRAADADGARQHGDLLSRWSLVLSVLVAEHYVLPLDTHSPVDDDVRGALARHAATMPTATDDAMEGRYREIWRTLTRDERLALRQLAEEGFVSPAATHTVRLLMRQRLVRREPMLAVASEGFRRFVLRAESPETIAEWESAHLSGMELAARFLPVALIGGLILIFTTQREAFNATTTLITTAGTAVPVLLKLLASAAPGRHENVVA